MPTHERPLSPHLQVYKLHRKIAPALSISHRITGMLMFCLGTLFVILWLGAAAYGPESFATAQALFASPLGYLVLFGWTVVLFYHMTNGIRHLVWDTGCQVSIAGVRRTGLTMLAAVVALTALVWIVGLAVAL
ncbi:succinate dehydrogenase, cytochrome b556 subunit [Roseospira marina]|uniref:Succinate dehydrogenase cytochrome b556 subunit n=1 Tax=Roseospira marina TaxID=140057 RepID=A0A5M6ICG2_9PROT|nr:succinate dehydrogenase, cytochrome b556 subunit [Roseospira marina]KAA5605964.1 succinate dehydrogenase, cytochrome b556 subunit [Roseospira marina]MBB4313189.1 succinate dehydrogenase / fumarate reductase cytochrome b subunit [Roseospira marina]MBB5086070.1 succinate dehydrogenase / fumarate reductase cytochrome b subunit [Roseospira marina]